MEERVRLNVNGAFGYGPRAVRPLSSSQRQEGR
jgi:hypothetical protein